MNTVYMIDPHNGSEIALDHNTSLPAVSLRLHHREIVTEGLVVMFGDLSRMIEGISTLTASSIQRIVW